MSNGKERKKWKVSSKMSGKKKEQNIRYIREIVSIFGISGQAKL